LALTAAELETSPIPFPQRICCVAPTSGSRLLHIVEVPITAPLLHRGKYA
jgi:hypothetical protein